MDVRIKTKDYEMLPDVATYLDERMKTIEKHLGEEADKVRMEVEIGKSAGHSKRGDNWFAEVQIIRPGEARARVTAKGETVNEAIDAAKEEILAKLRKGKTLRTTKVRETGAKVKSWLRSKK